MFDIGTLFYNCLLSNHQKYLGGFADLMRKLTAIIITLHPQPFLFPSIMS